MLDEASTIYPPEPWNDPRGTNSMSITGNLLGLGPAACALTHGDTPSLTLHDSQCDAETQAQRLTQLAHSDAC